MKKLKCNPDIVVRKTDKTNTFVIMSKVDHHDKPNKLFNDPEKFTKLPKDPSNNLKNDINKIASWVENKVFAENPNLVPELYCR